MASVIEELKRLASIDFFLEARKEETFIGRPFYFDFSVMRFLCNDKWKNSVGGIPAGTFTVAIYTGEEAVSEAVLLRVLRPTRLPTDDDVLAAMVDYYKESLPGAQPERLDSYTRAEFQFSGLECSVLGTFYKDPSGKTRLAGDIDNFYSPHNYRMYKPRDKALEYIVNFHADGIPGGATDRRIGRVRYSSSLRHAVQEDTPVYVSALDFFGKRTALFGMTRTGKSNTVKKVIQATVDISRSAQRISGHVIKPIGQIIFDVNGEYANENQQDEGTAIFAQFPTEVTRYSVLAKPGFKVLKLNFYKDLEAGFEMIRSLLADDSADYVRAFLTIDWSTPAHDDASSVTRYDRRVAAYQACLFKAGFKPPETLRAKFKTNDTIQRSTIPGLAGVDTSRGITVDVASRWFEAAWQNYDAPGGPFVAYRNQKGKDWADDDLKILMRFLTRRRSPSAVPSESGFLKLKPAQELHTATLDKPFEQEIIDLLRNGKIVIVDLSQGDPRIQRTYSDRVCRRIFADAMERFISNEDVNFIQLYFEEAHNLFPRKEESDLTDIYNRLAKEGQKLKLGLVYATQEVSSISASILKNTQNWFISHLNNADELREIAKYYDFKDFVDSLRQTMDKGFIRMKTDSNPFVVPVQIDRFEAAGG